MHPNALYLARLEFQESCFDQTDERIGIQRHFAMDDASGDRNGQTNQIVSGFFPDLIANPSQFHQAPRQAIHRRTDLILRLTAACRNTRRKSFSSGLLMDLRLPLGIIRL